MKKLIPLALASCSLENDSLTCENLRLDGQCLDSPSSIKAREALDANKAIHASSYDLEELRKSFHQAFLPEYGESMADYAAGTIAIRKDMWDLKLEFRNFSSCDADWLENMDEYDDLAKAVFCRSYVYRYFIGESHVPVYDDCTTEGRTYEDVN